MIIFLSSILKNITFITIQKYYLIYCFRYCCYYAYNYCYYRNRNRYYYRYFYFYRNILYYYYHNIYRYYSYCYIYYCYCYSNLEFFIDSAINSSDSAAVNSLLIFLRVLLGLISSLSHVSITLPLLSRRISSIPGFIATSCFSI